MTESSTRSSRSRQNLIRLAIWTAVWLISEAIAVFGSIFIWEGNVTISFFAILINAAVGLGMILAFVKHLNGLDELDQKISMDAMAIALGVGVVGGLSYSLMDITNVIPFDAEISFLVVLISITYIVAVLAGKLRYL